MTAAPPYLQIVAEYRRRIDAGELRPGDRLPSTRALAAEWAVAPGTAAKALAELTRAGVTRTQGRVGSIVAPVAGGGRPTLGRARIVAAAVGIADAEGLDAVSMRTVAARLGVAPMSLYRHVAGKEELLLHMADLAYGEDTYPDPLPEQWRTRLELAARTLWQLYRRHPWLTHLGPLGRPLALPNLLRHGEVVLSGLVGLGFPTARVLELEIVLFAHGQGLAVNFERDVQARSDTGMTDQQWEDVEVPRLRSLADRDGLPHLAGLLDGLAAGYDFDLDVLFEIGLQALLDGFAALARREGVAGPAART